MQHGESSELEAMSVILKAMRPLDSDTQERVVSWITSKLGLSEKHISGDGKFPNDQQVVGVKKNVREGTITTIAAKLDVKSCRDLMTASAVHLSLHQGKERFTKQEWIDCAKAAKHWKVNYSSQISTAIGRMLKAGEVNETAKDVFSVPDKKLKEIEGRLDS